MAGASGGWERFLAAERRHLEQRKNGQLRRLLNGPLPDETGEELERLDAEDERLAEKGLVALKRGEEIYYKHIDEFTPEDMSARLEAESELVSWLTKRTEELLPWLKGEFEKLDE